MRIKMLCARLICGCSLRNEMSSMPSNAGAHLLSEAGATQERALEAVGCRRWFGSGPATEQVEKRFPRTHAHAQRGTHGNTAITT